MSSQAVTALTINSTLPLNNGRTIPQFGLGTWRSDKGLVEAAVADALRLGYRHIDAAWIYKNQNEVGNGVAQVIKEGLVKREEIFITSKLWCTHLAPDRAELQLKEILSDLQTPYLDLLLIHWPAPLQLIDGSHPDAIFGKDEKGVRQHDTATKLTDTWRAMESFVDRGLVRSIGVSNFNEAEITTILQSARIKPVTNQVESHAYLQQKSLRAFCAKHGIHLTAYSPLGNMNPSDEAKLAESPLTNPTIIQMAKKYNKSPAQILIRFQLQLGHIVIPKSTTAKRIAENASVFDFAIDDGDMAQLEALDRNHRFINPPFRPDEGKIFSTL